MAKSNKVTAPVQNEVVANEVAANVQNEATEVAQNEATKVAQPQTEVKRKGQTYAERKARMAAREAGIAIPRGQSAVDYVANIEGPKYSNGEFLKLEGVAAQFEMGLLSASDGLHEVVAVHTHTVKRAGKEDVEAMYNYELAGFEEPIAETLLETFVVRVLK